MSQHSIIGLNTWEQAYLDSATAAQLGLLLLLFMVLFFFLPLSLLVPGDAPALQRSQAGDGLLGAARLSGYEAQSRTACG